MSLLRRRIVRAWLVVTVSSLATNAFAAADTWSPIGPYGGGLALLVEDPADPSLLYASTLEPSLLLRSRDAGKTWAPAANPGFSDGEPFASYLPGNGAIYADNGTGSKSVDGGFTWGELPNFPERLTITVSEPGNPQVVYGFADAGAVKSVDGGLNWTVLGTGVPNAGGWTDMLIDSTAVSTVYIYGYSQVLNSTDAGATWHEVRTGLGFFSVVAMVQFGSTLLVATVNQGFLRSVDGGATWTASNGGIADPRIYSLVKGPGASPVLYATAGPRDWPDLLRSVDGGLTWSPTAAGGISRVVVSRHRPHRLYGEMLGTVGVSDDDGRTWTPASLASGLPNPQTPVILVDGGDGSFVYAAVFSGPAGAVRSADRGATWGPMTESPLAASSTQAGTVYGVPPGGQAVYRSTDYGVTWRTLALAGTDVSLTAVAETGGSPQSLYLAGTRYTGSGRVPIANPTVQHSDDGGQTWSESETGLPGGGLSGLAAAANNAMTAYVRMSNSHVYRTVDGGMSWTDCSAGLPAGRILAMVVSPNDPNVVYVGVGVSAPATDRGFYATVDGGASWSARNSGLPDADVTAIAVDPLNPAAVYVGTGGLGVFRTADAGGHWTPFGAGLGRLAALDVNAIAIDPHDTHRLYAATGAGAYVMTTSNYSATDHVIEYYESSFDHYFIATETQPDVVALDEGRIQGWTRTGRAFAVYPLATAGTSAVCRFFSGQTFAPKSSHFYTPYPVECGVLKQGGVWQYEGDAFALKLPVGPAGQGMCAAGSSPLYRLYNNGQGGAPNHRYTDDLAVLAQMVTQGWVFEGEAQTKVFACVPSP
ncbi:MAG: hypothetical protein ABI886_07130 [Betaproteobacteria bacterium]